MTPLREKKRMDSALIDFFIQQSRRKLVDALADGKRAACGGEILVKTVGASDNRRILSQRKSFHAGIFSGRVESQAERTQ